MLTATRRKVKIGPEHHGQKMSLKAFEFVNTVEGYHYELSRGYITVSEPANLYHALILAFVWNQLTAHQLAHPNQIFAILTEMACKLLIPEWESERHPDIAVYFTKPKGKKDRTVWRFWIPELVIEIISAASDHRDYVEKRDEYWTLGVKDTGSSMPNVRKSSFSVVENRTGSKNDLALTASARPSSCRIQACLQIRLRKRGRFEQR